MIKEINFVNQGLEGVMPNLDLQGLKVLNLKDNSLTGNIPDFDLPNLHTLNLKSNALNGEIPDFSNLAKLQSLNNTLSSLDHCFLGLYLNLFKTDCAFAKDTLSALSIIYPISIILYFYSIRS